MTAGALGDVERPGSAWLAGRPRRPLWRRDSAAFFATLTDSVQVSCVVWRPLWPPYVPTDLRDLVSGVVETAHMTLGEAVAAVPAVVGTWRHLSGISRSSAGPSSEATAKLIEPAEPGDAYGHQKSRPQSSLYLPRSGCLSYQTGYRPTLLPHYSGSSHPVSLSHSFRWSPSCDITINDSFKYSQRNMPRRHRDV